MSLPMSNYSSRDDKSITLRDAIQKVDVNATKDAILGAQPHLKVVPERGSTTMGSNNSTAVSTGTNTSAEVGATATSGTNLLQSINNLNLADIMTLTPEQLAARQHALLKSFALEILELFTTAIQEDDYASAAAFMCKKGDTYTLNFAYDKNNTAFDCAEIVDRLNTLKEVASITPATVLK